MVLSPKTTFKAIFTDLTGLTLNFVRNLISIDDPEFAQVIVICYADSGMARLIQYIASAADLDEWHLHATEIFSGLLKDTSPKTISHVDPQKDALKHCSFMRPCLSIQETKVEVIHKYNIHFTPKHRPTLSRGRFKDSLYMVIERI